MAITLEQLWDISRVPFFDMDAPGFSEYANLRAYDDDFNMIPGYMPSDVVRKYADADVEEIAWHNLGIAVRFYKGDENDE